MLNQNSQKMSFDIKLPHDPKSKCNKFITKGYSMSVCVLNIIIKIGISIGLLMILLSQIKPHEVMNEITQNLPNKSSLIK